MKQEGASVASALALQDFLFKQIWVDLHQTMVLDRQGSYTRPVIGLVRCVCKDETEQTGRSSPIKMRICNLHFFAPIWMAQPIVHNFRRMSMIWRRQKPKTSSPASKLKNMNLTENLQHPDNQTFFHKSRVFSPERRTVVK